MERMGGFHRYRKHAKSSSTVLEVVQTNNTTTDATTKTATGAGDGAGNSTTNTTNNPLEPERALVCMVREQDQYMPIANVIRIMRRILPSHAKISDDAKETIQECVSEYISFVTGEANERCQREQRKTVTAEDILWAMGKLGFDDYVQPLTLFLSRYRDSESDRTSVRGEPPAATFVKRGAAAATEYGPVQVGVHGPYAPGFHVGHYPNVFDAPASAMGGYYRDGSGGAGTGSSAQNAMANFDPFAHFK